MTAASAKKVRLIMKKKMNVVLSLKMNGCAWVKRFQDLHNSQLKNILCKTGFEQNKQIRKLRANYKKNN